MTEQTSPPSRLPTFNKLGVTPPSNVDATAIASKWLESFSAAVKSQSADQVLSLFAPDAFWRDILALTWDFRTFDGTPKIRSFVTERLFSTTFDEFKMRDFVRFQQQFPDLAWIVAMFDFSTGFGIGLGVVRLIPTAEGEWKAFTMFTNLENLQAFPENIGPRRVSEPNLGKWEADRQREIAFEEADPVVIVVGGNHSGLEAAARLKYLGVPTLVVESHARIGDSWRKRYSALCLHFPVHNDHMPYLPFPPTWPLYTPSLKMADWLESYAHHLELNVWTSSTVTNAIQDDVTGKWTVTIERSDGTKRILTVNHLVFATGVGVRRIPSYPDMDKFQGEIIHSEEYKDATGYEGKKVLVIGSGNSGNDISADLAKSNIDVTMFQRSSTFVMNLRTGWKFMGGALYSDVSPPVDLADRLSESLPQLLKENGLAQRSTKAAMANDKALLDGLNKAGFKTNSGIRGTGFLLLLKGKGGGHLFDSGSCQLIIDGKIKIKNDSAIKQFTARGLAFENGSTLDADVVVFATGYSDPREFIRRACGDAVADRCKPVSGLDAEGEMRGLWRDVGVRNLWYMKGSLAMCRFHSKHLALQIKAIEEGIFGTRYSLVE